MTIFPPLLTSSATTSATESPVRTRLLDAACARWTLTRVPSGIPAKAGASLAAAAAADTATIAATAASGDMCMMVPSKKEESSSHERRSRMILALRRVMIASTSAYLLHRGKRVDEASNRSAKGRVIADRHGPLPALLHALTVVTGLVDAVSYLALGHVFVANMTGNVIFLGLSAFGAPGISAVTSLTSIAAFLAAGVAGGRMVRAHTHRGRLLAHVGAARGRRGRGRCARGRAPAAAPPPGERR